MKRYAKLMLVWEVGYRGSERGFEFSTSEDRANKARDRFRRQGLENVVVWPRLQEVAWWEDEPEPQSEPRVTVEEIDMDVPLTAAVRER